MPSKTNSTNSKKKSTAAKPRSNASQKRPAAAKAPSERYRKKFERERRNREIVGIILIALGLFFALTNNASTGIFGELISGFTFGLLGWGGYALPIIFMAFGIYTIALAGRKNFAANAFVVILLALSIVSMGHISFYDNLVSVDSNYIEFLAKSFELGELHATGAGLFGALLTYPTIALIGKAGAYILFITLSVICLVILTNLSIRNTGAKVGSAIKQNISTIKAKNFEKAAQRRELSEARAEYYNFEDPLSNENTSLQKNRSKVNSSPKTQSFDFMLDDDPHETPGKRTSKPTKSNDAQNPIWTSVDMSNISNYQKKNPKKTGFNYYVDQENQGFAMDFQDNPAVFEPPIDPFRPYGVEQAQEFSSDDSLYQDTYPYDDYDFTQDPLYNAENQQDQDYEKYLPKFDDGSFDGLEAQNLDDFDNDTLHQPAVEGASSESCDALNPSDSPESKPPKPVYAPPSLSCLRPPEKSKTRAEDPGVKARLLEETLQSFGIVAKVINVTQGPAITRYELQPAPGVRVNRITNLSDDIALNLAASRVRIEAPIPGKAAVGIEVPNKNIHAVSLREIIDSPDFKKSKSKVTVALGKDIAGKIILADIGKMPHLLIAGSTGSGKSVCINCIICSLIYHAKPEDVQLILVDPKVVELAAFSNLPHLLIPVVTDPKEAANALKWAVKEMVDRYNKFAQCGARDLARYNEISIANGQDKTPQVIVIIDELADLMMVAPDDVEDAICRIAQMGRASGIHLIVATQRPSADIITGIIKANIPSRIAFAVASATDSRIILDSGGAEKLLGKGDMLFSPIGASQALRVQGALVTDQEIEKIKDHFSKLAQPVQYNESAQEGIAKAQITANDAEAKSDEDELLATAVELLMQNGQASISMLQRRLRIGYSRAARLIDSMEESGIVSGFEGSKARKVLISRAEFEKIFGYPPNIADLGV